MSIRWMRVILGALLLEAILGVTLVPLSFVNMTLFLTAVPIGAFVFGYLVSWWILRKVPSAPLLHGALIGIVATALYLGLVFAQPGGFSSAVSTYGVTLFWFSQALRIAGCVAGAAANRKPAPTRSARKRGPRRTSRPSVGAEAVRVDPQRWRHRTYFTRRNCFTVSGFDSSNPYNIIRSAGVDFSAAARSSIE